MMMFRVMCRWLACGYLLISTSLVAMNPVAVSTGASAPAAGATPVPISTAASATGEPNVKAPTATDGKVADSTKPAMHKDDDDDDDDDDDVVARGALGNRYWGNQPYYWDQRRSQNDYTTRANEIMEILRQLPKQTKRIEGNLRKLRTRRDKLSQGDPARERIERRIKAYENCTEMLEAAITKQDPIGIAIARGLAGGAWEAIKDQPVSSISDGVMLGGALLISTKCSDAFGKRIANTVDRVIGGTWDWCINGLINAWHALGELVFPDAAKPFDFKTLGIWQDFIKIMFNDIEKFLKEGLKDSLRGKDSTLRKVDEAAADDAQTMNVWRMLIEGYARQIDFFVSTIDQNIAATQGAWVAESNVVFFAQELRRRLLEFQAIITKAKTLKEFDALIDSNKSLITGYRCNIESLLQRLIASIDQPVSTTDASASNNKPNRMSNRSVDDDDNKLPGSFLGR